MDNIKVGVIGVGHLGMHHARVYTEILGAQLVGAVDINEERAHAVCEPLGVAAYNGIESFIKHTRPDALSIVVPTCQHFEIAKIAMENGIHVLIEKPVTSSVDEAEQLLKLAVKKDLILQVGHIERFNSAVQHVREFIKDPYFIQTHRMGPFTPRISDVGVVLDLMIHDVDIILSLINSELVSISAIGRCIRTDHEDIASAQLTFANGAMAQILVSRVSEKRIRQMEITEAERYITVNYESQDISVQRCVRQSGGNLVEVMEHPVFPKTEPLKMELQHFVSCVREGRQPMVGIKDGKRALEVCVAVLRQIHEEKSAAGSLLSAI
ncbi:MAG: Gfo/Idh/MocA family oxidoreductase [Synergistaceae bacterium]|nr:Gfo/Idh/MocA family oxidoreductase [Synergistaceae bacterium]